MNHFVRRYASLSRSDSVDDPSPRSDEREALAIEHVSLVKLIAGRIVSRLPGHYELDDLYSAGVIGLLTAIDNFDESKGIPFDRYARIRIEGAVLDALRQSDHLPRTRRIKNKKLEAARAQLEKELGRPATDYELADASGESVESVQASMLEAIAPTFLGPADLARVSPASPHAADNPFERIASQEAHEALAKAIDRLPDRLRLLMSLYYREELSYKEIGGILEISESRVCHLHADAVRRLRKMLSED